MCKRPVTIVKTLKIEIWSGVDPEFSRKNGIMLTPKGDANLLFGQFSPQIVRTNC